MYLEATQLDSVTTKFTCFTNGTVTAIVPRLVNFANSVGADPVNKNLRQFYNRFNNRSS